LHILETCSILDSSTHDPKQSSFLASRAIIHSEFSLPEMQNNFRTSQEPRQAQNSNECWWPDQDAMPTGHRRASGLRPHHKRSWICPP
jgi:hypothetical protein